MRHRHQSRRGRVRARTAPSGRSSGIHHSSSRGSRARPRAVRSRLRRFRPRVATPIHASSSPRFQSRCGGMRSRAFAKLAAASRGRPDARPIHPMFSHNTEASEPCSDAARDSRAARLASASRGFPRAATQPRSDTTPTPIPPTATTRTAPSAVREIRRRTCGSGPLPTTASTAVRSDAGRAVGSLARSASRTRSTRADRPALRTDGGTGSSLR